MASTTAAEQRKFTGVYTSRDGRWRAKIFHDGEVEHLGDFSSAVEAARAWDAYVLDHQLARQLNFPPPREAAGAPGDAQPASVAAAAASPAGEPQPQADVPPLPASRLGGEQAASAPRDAPAIGERESTVPATVGRKHALGLRGVSRTKNGRWVSRISVARKLEHLGVFDSSVDAARAYDARAAELNRDLNFPAPAPAPRVAGAPASAEPPPPSGVTAASLRPQLSSQPLQLAAPPPCAHGLGGAPAASAARRPLTRTASTFFAELATPFRGVRARGGRWEASVHDDGGWHYIGQFETDIDAALAVDEHVVRRGLACPLNFPHDGAASHSGAQTLPPPPPPAAAPLPAPPRAQALPPPPPQPGAPPPPADGGSDSGKRALEPAEGAAPFTGVYWRKGRWLAGIRHHRKKRHLGVFASAVEAARAVDAFVVRHGIDRALNMPPGTDAADLAGTTVSVVDPDARPQPPQPPQPPPAAAQPPADGGFGGAPSLPQPSQALWQQQPMPMPMLMPMPYLLPAPLGSQLSQQLQLQQLLLQQQMAQLQQQHMHLQQQAQHLRQMQLQEHLLQLQQPSASALPPGRHLSGLSLSLQQQPQQRASCEHLMAQGQLQTAASAAEAASSGSESDAASDDN